MTALDTQANPEIGTIVNIKGVNTNLHINGTGFPVLMLHGSGPGVTAWANWRLSIPVLSREHQVIAPDMLGFGYTDPTAGNQYSMDKWVNHAIDILDHLNIEQTDLIGNSFGGALALALAIRHPGRIRRLILMGSVGVHFPITAGLDQVWGYQPSVAAMKSMMGIFAYNRELVTDAVAESRYKASIRDGVQEAFSAMFPAPRQRWVDAMCSPEEAIRNLPHETLIIHGREDEVIPLQNSLTLNQWINKSQLHVFGRCGHWTQIEHTDRFNQLVSGFLREADQQKNEKKQ
jgi:2-hydroxymuconate-semialdehyde hydrolase